MLVDNRMTVEQYELIAKFKKIGDVGDSFWYLGSKFYITGFGQDTMSATYMHSGGIANARFSERDLKPLYSENSIDLDTKSLDLENLISYAEIARDRIKTELPYNDLLVSKLDYFINKVKDNVQT